MKPLLFQAVENPPKTTPQRPCRYPTLSVVNNGVNDTILSTTTQDMNHTNSYGLIKGLQFGSFVFQYYCMVS